MKKDLAASEAADVSLLTRVVLGIFASDEHAARREKVATAMGLQVHFSLSKMSGEKKVCSETLEQTDVPQPSLKSEDYMCYFCSYFIFSL